MISCEADLGAVEPAPVSNTASGRLEWCAAPCAVTMNRHRRKPPVVSAPGCLRTPGALMWGAL
jgi:hypothetical protein